ncbi:RDD family protein [Candidatus Eisenbacteria bacterium]|uniref:RDD family protein n=1 Tax=Eiseniibacteriota bacterium TaxID=2212470 RepID=A0ABV6YMT7_UNCEI
MALLFKCSACGQEVAIRFLKVGEEVKCPGCGHHGVVPPNAQPVVADDFPHGIRPGEFIPPVASDARLEVPDHPQYLAARGKRFWGYLIDWAFVAIPVGALGFLSAGSLPSPDSLTRHQLFLRWLETPWATAAVFVIFAVGAFQAYLLITRGQTFGKRVLGMRIVTMDYRHPSWWRLVLVRPLILVLASYRPHIQWTDAEWGGIVRLAFSILFTVNALFVFNSDRRALHDHLAGTQVVDIKLMRNG